MEFTKVQHFGNGVAYATLRQGILKKGQHASRFDCSPVYEAALHAVKMNNLPEAERLITEAGILDSKDSPPDWCYDG